MYGDAEPQYEPISQRPVIRDEQGKAVMFLPTSKELAEELVDCERFLGDMGLLTQSEWWQDHRDAVSAAVERVGMDLRRGRYL